MDNSTRRALAVITEMVAGAFLGGVVSYLVGIALGRVVPAPSEGFSDIGLILLAIAILYPAAAAVGVWFTGSRVYQRPGSFWMALLGALGGLVLTVILTAIAGGLTQLFFFVLIPILSALVFTWSAGRREKSAAA